MKIRLNKWPVILFCFVASVFLYIPLDALSDSNTDNTEIAEASLHLEYLSPIFAYKGRPLNNDTDRKSVLLINHGYMVGFSEDRKQPLWAVYRVSRARRSVDYERPPFFYEDLRLTDSARVSPDTFAGYDRGHMAPNLAINTQYGQLAQLETFLMSNICPQHKDLNRGLWQTLEHRIVNNYAPARDHIWVISGPIFEHNIGQVNGVDIPTHFFMILVDVGQWPTFRPYIMAFKFPQQPSDGAKLSDFFVSINHIEEKTSLNFFPQFDSTQESDYETGASSEVWPLN